MGECFFDARDAVADHRQIVACLDGEADGLCKSEVVEDSTHVEIVGHDESGEPLLVAEEVGDDSPREGGGEFFGLKRRIEGVANHHGIHTVADTFEDVQFVGFEVRFCKIDDWKLVMGI